MSAVNLNSGRHVPPAQRSPAIAADAGQPPSHPSLPHLHGHHGDFEAFRDLMIATSAGRFGAVFWGVFDQYIAPKLPTTGGVLLDVGCGPGGLFAPLRSRRSSTRIVGLDVQPAMVEAARVEAEKLGHVEVIEADLAGALPLPTAGVDVAVASMVLHEMPFPIRLLRELHRVVRPGGALLVYDWVRQPLASYAGDAPLTPELLQHFREHCLYTAEDLVFLAERSGWTLQESIGRRGNHYAMLALDRGLADAVLDQRGR